MTFLWIALAVLGLVVSLFILLWINAIRASRVRDRKLDQLIRPAIEAVRENLPLAHERITELAAVPAARNHLFTRLREMGRAHIFPPSFRTVEKVAESDLARWLMHPNELGSAPSDMELIRGIGVQEETKRGNIYLFRFRTEPSHWASERGWMAGV